WRDGRTGVGEPRSTVESGERATRPGAGGGKGAPGQPTVGGKHGGCSGTPNRVNATTADSRACQTGAADGVHLAEPQPQPELVAGGLLEHTQRRGPRRGRTDLPGLRGEPGCQ